MKTMKQLANDAIAVQSAVNLSGIVHSFSSGITDLRAHLEAEGKGGTDNVNTHPYCVLFTDKMGQLSGSGSYGDEVYRRAIEWANEEVAKE